MSALWRRRIEPYLRPFIYAGFRLRRGLTLGVRGIVTDSQGRVLLVEHTYVHGWHLPGGGVEWGETAEHALGRELMEEAGVRLTGPARLLSIHCNQIRFRGDHVLVFQIGAWEPCEASAEGEIHNVGWFSLDDLPDGATRGTRARLAEALGGEGAAAYW